MPDLMTHLLAPYTVGRLALKSRQRLALLCAGAVLPDLLSRVPAIVLGQTQVAWVFSAFHTPVGVLVFCLGAVFAFPREMRRLALGWLLAGAGSIFCWTCSRKRSWPATTTGFSPFPSNSSRWSCSGRTSRFTPFPHSWPWP